ncbi:hypothetical protein Baya_16010 [Bagarius yarrelli]|uniref:Uncharacterized protein n=1 Tax=Bagarius yarrelli TaxID=175774 RepID=A0A556VU79_BAGYA|nr:hypothetical protein Baya_16010 [Bagarius yarrelli]
MVQWKMGDGPVEDERWFQWKMRDGPVEDGDGPVEMRDGPVEDERCKHLSHDQQSLKTGLELPEHRVRVSDSVTGVKFQRDSVSEGIMASVYESVSGDKRDLSLTLLDPHRSPKCSCRRAESFWVPEFRAESFWVPDFRAESFWVPEFRAESCSFRI